MARVFLSDNALITTALVASAVYTLSSMFQLACRTAHSFLSFFYPAVRFLYGILDTLNPAPWIPTPTALYSSSGSTGTPAQEARPIVTLVKRTAAGYLVPFALVNGSSVSILEGADASPAAPRTSLNTPASVQVVLPGLVFWLTVFAGGAAYYFYPRAGSGTKSEGKNSKQSSQEAPPALFHPVLLLLAMASSGIDENLLKAMLTPLPLDDTVQGTDYPTSVDANRTNNFLRGVIASGTTGRSADLGDSHRTGRTDAWIDAQQNLSSQSSTLTQPTPATADPPIPSLPLRTRVSALKSATGPSSWPIPPPRSASSPLNPTAPVFTPRTNRNSGVGPSMAAQTPTAFGGSAWSLCSPASSASPATPHFTAQSNFATQRPVPSRLGQCVVVPMSPFVPRKPLEPLNTNIMGPGGPDAGMVGANPAQVCPFF